MRRFPLLRPLAVLNVFTLLVTSGVILVRPTRVLAQEAQPPSLSAAELDDVVARVALYPDSLLAQVLAASSFTEQIPDAYKWANSHKNLKGDALVDAMEKGQLAFDPSVQALIPFPTVLEMMNQDIAWSQKLGDAVLVQRGDVMDAVQRMRKKAQDAGNLKSTEQIKVVQSSPQVIEIQTPSPQVVYVPTYNPQVVYAPARPPPSNTGAVVAASLIAFTAGVAITAAFSDGWWGHSCGFGWSSHTVIVHNSAWGRTWVNHRSYAHAWGGYNRGFYSRPYAYANTNVYARRNVNVNVNNNVNVNRNVNVNQNTNINRNVNQNVNQNVNRNANLNQNVNRDANVNQARAQNYNRDTNHVGATNRGYTQPSSSAGAFSGANNGRADHAAANRGHASRRR